MKNFLFASVAVAAVFAGATAQAADLPNRKQAPMVAQVYTAPAFSWTGFYVGANAGLGTGSFTKDNGSSFGTPPVLSLAVTVRLVPRDEFLA